MLMTSSASRELAGVNCDPHRGRAGAPDTVRGGVDHVETVYRRSEWSHDYATQRISYRGKLVQLGNHSDALELFAKRLQQSGGPVRFYCGLPTWCPDSDCDLDLHDLHDLKSRFLVFIHGLIESLAAAGIPASYRLAPTSSPLCVVCALPPHLDGPQAKRMTLQAAKDAKLTGRGKVLLTELEHGSALIIS
ncbi:hypothetical protein PUNSTDRAFT_41214 [Punctularia strigosozonata HHB-11173 SS5]|uniref:uncharacterized protein n=1 Tax=Punctularia strigosozonata (strain HHB-11173) TaxID=741275 RepID=UPI0004416ACF|nr:uncharacterized protein PUNSTDRAFT_41214 [Punctularia strigosozonata HHB-11173 SS5]EIN13749.1 hypothetical protein PUNSTDRAFT_41214 [Punctularia strigosozonata HHB-11173 SS5]